MSEMDSNLDDSQSSGGEFGTPSKVSQQSQAASTSFKRKLEFDFWSKSSTTDKKPKIEGDVVQKTEVIIADIRSGKGQASSIRFRVSNKSAKIISKNGIPMFKFSAMDASGEIVVVAYAEATAKWFDLLMVNRCFELVNFDVKEEDPKYRSNTGHDFEIVLNNSAIIEELKVEHELPVIPFNFLDIDQVLGKPDKSTVDTLGIMVQVWELEQVKNTVKRDLVFTDKTKSVLLTTLWGKQAEEFKEELFTVFAVRNGSTALYAGNCTMNIYSGTLLWPNPNLDEARELFEWFEENKPE